MVINNDHLYCGFKVDGAWKTAAYNYGNHRLGEDFDGAIDRDTSASGIKLTEGQGTPQTYNHCGFTLWFSSPDDMVDKNRCYYICNYDNDGNDQRTVLGGGSYDGTDVERALSGIRFFGSTGDLTCGDFRLYGMKQ